MNINSLIEFILNRQRGDSFCVSALSNDPSLDKSVEEVCLKLKNSPNADIAIVLISSNFASDYPRLLPLLKRKLKYKMLIGSAVGGVIGLSKNNSLQENFNLPSLSITLLKLSNSNIIPFHIPENINIDMDNPCKVWRNLIKDFKTCKSDSHFVLSYDLQLMNHFHFNFK